MWQGGRRLIVEIPPRHGKSTIVSQGLPVWFLELFPERHIILASYEAGFAAEWGRAVRNLVAQYAGELTVRISEDSSAANRWHTPQGGGMVTAGVDGPITGRGADLFVIDDPVKSWAQAQSPAYRAHLWDWWHSTAKTRLEPAASVILCMARWHEDDLAGKLIREMDAGGQPWEVIRLPAVAEDGDPLGRALGEPLWPERFPAEALAEIQRSSPSYVWNALYQQRPERAGDAVFQTWAIDAAFQR